MKDGKSDPQIICTLTKLNQNAANSIGCLPITNEFQDPIFTSPIFHYMYDMPHDGTKQGTNYSRLVSYLVISIMQQFYCFLQGIRLLFLFEDQL